MGAELRLGRQVVSWGESTFIQNGINVINHFDVSALRVPGSELKEAFLPQEMVNFSLQFNDNLSAQAIYITDWNATVPGTGRFLLQQQRFRAHRRQQGGARLRLVLRPGRGFPPARRPVHRQFPDREPPGDARRPHDSGQYGFNLKYFAPDFNNGTEFGLFFLNYHSRLPLISGRPARRRASATPSAR